MKKTPGDESRKLERLRNRYVTSDFLLSVRYPYPKYEKSMDSLGKKSSLLGAIKSYLRSQLLPELLNLLDLQKDPTLIAGGIPL